MDIILASGSKYRAQLLSEAGYQPLIIKPMVDEDKVKLDMNLESPLEIAQILAFKKAADAVLQIKNKNNFIIIGSDQICLFNNEILNKPENKINNIKHLKKLQGHTHQLITCVCLLIKKQNYELEKLDFYNTTHLKMKTLSSQQIQDYVEKDKAYDCAGGYKFESLGHQLMENVTTDDETAIQGLPMIELSRHLKRLIT